MAPRQGADSDRRRAFTIIELTIVIMIMAMLAAGAAPRYRAALANYRVNAAAGRVAADLRMIRQYARKVSTPQTVQFNVAADSYAAPSMPDMNGRATTYSVSLGTTEYVADVTSATFAAARRTCSLTFTGDQIARERWSCRRAG